MAFLDHFKRKVIERGLEYHQDDQVLDIDQLDEETYEGSVEGSGDVIYDVHIDLIHPEQSSCTCPYAAKGKLCKHMTALYFEAFPDEAEEYEDDHSFDDEDDLEEDEGPELFVEDEDLPDEADMEEALYELVGELLEDDADIGSAYAFMIVDKICERCLDAFKDAIADHDGDLDEALEDEDFRDHLEDVIGDYADEEDPWDDQGEPDDPEDDMVIEPDQTPGPDSIHIFTDDLNRSRKDPFYEGFTNYYDKKGKRIGSSRKGIIFEDVTYYYDEHDRKIGYSRKDPLFDGFISYYDMKGRKIGSSRQDPFFDAYTAYYDRSGKKIGESREDPFFAGERKYKKKK